MRRFDVISAFLFSLWLITTCAAYGADPVVPSAEPRYGPRFKELTKNLSKEELALIEECRVNFGRLKNVYNNSQIDATYHPPLVKPTRKSRENPTGTNMMRLSYRTNGGKWFRMDAEALDPGTQASTGRMSVHLIGPEFMFTASKDGPDKSLAVVRVYQDPKDPLERSFRRYDFQDAPYAIRAERLIFGEEDGWQIDRVEEFDEAGVRLTAINASGEFDGKRSAARYEFLRDSAWAIRAYSRGVASPSGPDDSVGKGTVEYEGEKDRVPLLKNVKYWQEVGPEKRRSREEEYTITRFIPEPAPEADFLPEALGLAMAGSKVNWWPRILVFGFAIILIAIYVRLKRRAAA